ncbi:MAG: Spx/MgsR family RNA polymerase-binding regulatory protein [Oscillospiraceae bacterium]
MELICYENCSTCKMAKKWLLDNELEFEERDIKKNRPNERELREWYKKSGLTLDKFFNKNGLLYRALELKDQLPYMAENEQLRLLASDGMLIKRPILIADNGKILVGFNESEWETVKK